MTTLDQRPARLVAKEPDAATGLPRVAGDELFVPASHVLITDQRVSHPAFRLWCVLHRLWFLREPPTMELLQHLMGSAVDPRAADPAAPGAERAWQPATRRSVERWLRELERAGWLVWLRREETTRRYHLRTSARSAGDTAILTELRSLLNSGKATLADIQALLGPPVDTTPESHHTTQGSHFHALSDTNQPGGATPESHHATPGSHDTTPESHHATSGSHDTTPESHHATSGSHGGATDGRVMRRNLAPIHENHQKRELENPTPPPVAGALSGDGGGGLTATARFLIHAGFSTQAAHTFQKLDLAAAQADLQRRRELGQGIGAVVTAWRLAPPEPIRDMPGSSCSDAPDYKAQALALAPAGVTELEVQYLALDLEEGVPPDDALANLLARRGPHTRGGHQ